MTTPAGIERTIRQLDNDVQSIYELLASITATQNRHTNRLDEIDLKLDRILDLLSGDDQS